MRAAGTLLLLCCCALPGGDVLEKGIVYSTCDDSISAASKGDPCTLTMSCVISPDCCTTKVLCESGSVYSSDRDCSKCSTCTDDDGCTMGNWCIEKLCQPCPEIVKCEACPPGQDYQPRNGCKSCTCG